MQTKHDFDDGQKSNFFKGILNFLRELKNFSNVAVSLLNSTLILSNIKSKIFGFFKLHSLSLPINFEI